MPPPSVDPSRVNRSASTARSGGGSVPAGRPSVPSSPALVPRYDQSRPQQQMQLPPYVDQPDYSLSSPMAPNRNGGGVSRSVAEGYDTNNSGPITTNANTSGSTSSFELAAYLCGPDAYTIATLMEDVKLKAEAKRLLANNLVLTPLAGYPLAPADVVVKVTDNTNGYMTIEGIVTLQTSNKSILRDAIAILAGGVLADVTPFTNAFNATFTRAPPSAGSSSTRSINANFTALSLSKCYVNNVIVYPTANAAKPSTVANMARPANYSPPQMPLGSSNNLRMQASVTNSNLTSNSGSQYGSMNASQMLNASTASGHAVQTRLPPSSRPPATAASGSSRLMAPSRDDICYRPQGASVYDRY